MPHALRRCRTLSMSDAVFATRLGHTPRLNMHQAWECAQLQPTRFHHGVRGAGDRDASHLERHVISPLLYLGLHMRLCDHRFVRHLQQNRRVIPRLVSRCGILLTCRTIGEPSTPADILRIPSASVSEKSLLPASSPSAVCNECLTVLSTMTTPIDSRTNPLKRHGGLISASPSGTAPLFILFMRRLLFLLLGPTLATLRKKCGACLGRLLPSPALPSWKRETSILPKACMYAQGAWGEVYDTDGSVRRPVSWVSIRVSDCEGQSRHLAR